MIRAVHTRVAHEPVAAVALLQAALGVATAFGFHLTGEQVSTLLAFSGLAFAAIARAMVTPNAKFNSALLVPDEPPDNGPDPPPTGPA